MNTGTLVGSLIFAAVLVVLMVVVTRLMVRGWRHRAVRQAELIGTLPGVPDTVGPAIVATRGKYLGCVLVPSRQDRIAVGDLAYPSRAVLIRYPEGIMVQRSGARAIWIPRESITAIHAERGLAGLGPGRVVARDGILAIRWRLPSGAEIDTGFRGNDRREHAGWLEEVA